MATLVFRKLNTCALIAMLLLMGQAVSKQVRAQQTVENFTFCYENKPFPPHFLGESLNVPKEKPGAMIDILRELDTAIDEIHIAYIREPWSRCLKSLKEGKVTAVVGSYSNSRAQYGVFPRLNGELDKRRAFDSLATCLIQKKGLDPVWFGKKLSGNKEVWAAVPFGYTVINDIKEAGFLVYETSSIDSAHGLLKSNRVSVSIVDCYAKNIPTFAQLLAPPVREHYGYLIINKQFYQQNPTLSERIWTELTKIDKRMHHQKYM